MTKQSVYPIPTLVRTRVRRLAQEFDEIREFETAIQQHTGWATVSGPAGMPLPIIKLVARVVRVLGLMLETLLRPLHSWCGKNYLCIGYIAPHYMAYKSFPYFSLPGATRMVWMYDAWENQLEAIGRAFRTHRINVALVSSRQAAEYFASLGIDNFSACWLPEAITTTNYPSKPANEREIDVLQMGRRWNDYHRQIEPFCRSEKIRYVYESKPGAIIFATYREFVAGLGNSKISICVPSAITHPARSGRISTMTWRYLQSMAAKCLVLGRMPEEMNELFDYQPVIEIDMNDPCGQLRSVLEDYTEYLPLIEKNYDYVTQNHQWRNRIDAMNRFLSNPS